MKPHVICHMVASVDGRILIGRWRPADSHQTGLFDRLHELLGSDAWLVGRVTGQEYPKRDAYSASADQSYPREPWFARRAARAYGDRARRARQDWLGTLGHRRRSYRGR